MKKIFSVLSVFLCSIFLMSSTRKEAKLPNVLLILTDDQGYGDLKIHGNQMIETPNMDNLAKESAQFERFYVSPLCAPTRASLLTGRYHLRTGTVSVSKGLEIMRENETTLAEMFKENGYKTGIFGKWHNGKHYPNHPNGQGFDEFFGFCGGHWTNYFDTILEHNGKDEPTKGYITDILTEKALDFIENNKKQPFFCYVPYNAPHSPHQVPDKFFDKYKAKGLDDELASIYGMCDNMDENIGKLLQKLDDSGLSENTIVIFMTDNGPNGVRYNANMKGIKGSVDEGGVRVPCFVRWKGKITPHKIKTLGSHIDIFPTLQEICGLKSVKTKPLDGISLVKSLLGNDQKVEREIYSHVAQPEKNIKAFPGAVRTNQYRLIVKENTTELYDMLKDPEQKYNIASTETATLEKLKSDYQNWFADVSKEIKPELSIPISSKLNYIELPTYEADFSGNITYKEGHGWVHDWLVNWTSWQDTISWNVQSLENQQLTVKVNYTCPEYQVGSELQLSIGKQKIKGVILEAFNPPMIPSPDRVKRKEVYEKEWKSLTLGKIMLPKGKNRIVLTAPKIAHSEVAEIKSIVLVK